MVPSCPLLSANNAPLWGFTGWGPDIVIVRDNQISFRPQLTFGSEWDRILVSVNTLLVCLLCTVGSQTKQERSKEARAVKISLLPSFTWHWQEKLLWRLLKYMFILPFLSLNKILKIIDLNHLLITKVGPFWNSIRLWIDCEYYETKGNFTYD